MLCTFSELKAIALQNAMDEYLFSEYYNFGGKETLKKIGRNMKKAVLPLAVAATLAGGVAGGVKSPEVRTHNHAPGLNTPTQINQMYKSYRDWKDTHWNELAKVPQSVRAAKYDVRGTLPQAKNEDTEAYAKHVTTPLNKIPNGDLTTNAKTARAIYSSPFIHYKK